MLTVLLNPLNKCTIVAASVDLDCFATMLVTLCYSHSAERPTMGETKQKRVFLFYERCFREQSPARKRETTQATPLSSISQRQTWRRSYMDTHGTLTSCEDGRRATAERLNNSSRYRRVTREAKLNPKPSPFQKPFEPIVYIPIALTYIS